jgi:hypothetical protein
MAERDAFHSSTRQLLRSLPDEDRAALCWCRDMLARAVYGNPTSDHFIQQNRALALLERLIRRGQ